MQEEKDEKRAELSEGSDWLSVFWVLWRGNSRPRFLTRAEVSLTLSLSRLNVSTLFETLHTFRHISTIVVVVVTTRWRCGSADTQKLNQTKQQKWKVRKFGQKTSRWLIFFPPPVLNYYYYYYYCCYYYCLHFEVFNSCLGLLLCIVVILCIYK